MGFKYDLTGKKFNRLLVLEYAYSKNKSSYWKCLCDCGNEKIIRSDLLKGGIIKSCSCQQYESTGIKHGMHKTKLYHVWAVMKNRCQSPNNSQYHNYGGVGVMVCEEWQTFVPFHEWATNNGYSEGLSIDRIDVYGNYEPSNCRWITMSEQQNNKRNTIWLTYEGETKNVAQWAAYLGVTFDKLYYRLKKYDWNIEAAIKSLK